MTLSPKFYFIYLFIYLFIFFFFFFFFFYFIFFLSIYLFIFFFFGFLPKKIPTPEYFCTIKVIIKQNKPVHGRTKAQPAIGNVMSLRQMPEKP